MVKGPAPCNSVRHIGRNSHSTLLRKRRILLHRRGDISSQSRPPIRRPLRCLRVALCRRRIHLFRLLYSSLLLHPTHPRHTRAKPFHLPLHHPLLLLHRALLTFQTLMPDLPPLTTTPLLLFQIWQRIRKTIEVRGCEKFLPWTTGALLGGFGDAGGGGDAGEEG